jgi:hypothetical protein
VFLWNFIGSIVLLWPPSLEGIRAWWNASQINLESIPRAILGGILMLLGWGIFAGGQKIRQGF